MKNSITTTILSALLTLVLTTFCPAAESGQGNQLEQLWSYKKLYSSKENSFIQSLTTTGRLQYDYSYFDEDTAGSQTETQWRRARVGFKATLFNKITVHSEMDMDLNNHDPIYNRLTDSYISWAANDTWTIKVGKQSAPFTLDGATSSKKLIAIERSKVAGNLWFGNEYFSGITVSGETGNWVHNYGIFSNDNGPEFSEVGNEKYFLLLSSGYDFAEQLGVDQALIRVDYVYNRESENLGTRSLESILSVAGQYDKGAMHLWGDITYGKSFNGNDIFALSLMPFYDINERIQLVGRYTYLTSSDNNALGLSRYERNLVSGRGNEVDEFYFGVNLYFYEHYLKWQNGIQFTDMKDDAHDGGAYSGFGFTSALRVSW